MLIPILIVELVLLVLELVSLNLPVVHSAESSLNFAGPNFRPAGKFPSISRSFEHVSKKRKVIFHSVRRFLGLRVTFCKEGEWLYNEPAR